MESTNRLWYIGGGVLLLLVVGFMALPTWFVEPLLYVLLLAGSVILIFLVLIQRGKGGGLAGALGGMGGYSAFGTRAGDVFTRVTLVAALLWILAAMGLANINLSGIQKNPAAKSGAKSSQKANRADGAGGESAAGLSTGTDSERSGEQDDSEH